MSRKSLNLNDFVKQIFEEEEEEEGGGGGRY